MNENSQSAAAQEEADARELEGLRRA